mmetsp:Transcript_10776/g.34163  ORF Transcript_10776/g.34163 Transcript_10776/m.34163 type:complete len:323 (+) Transcript_10776:371-1339(+)
MRPLCRQPPSRNWLRRWTGLRRPGCSGSRPWRPSRSSSAPWTAAAPPRCARRWTAARAPWPRPAVSCRTWPAGCGRMPPQRRQPPRPQPRRLRQPRPTPGLPGSAVLWTRACWPLGSPSAPPGRGESRWTAAASPALRPRTGRSRAARRPPYPGTCPRPAPPRPPPWPGSARPWGRWRITAQGPRSQRCGHSATSPQAVLMPAPWVPLQVNPRWSGRRWPWRRRRPPALTPARSRGRRRRARRPVLGRVRARRARRPRSCSPSSCISASRSSAWVLRSCGRMSGPRWATSWPAALRRGAGCYRATCCWRSPGRTRWGGAVTT